EGIAAARSSRRTTRSWFRSTCVADTPTCRLSSGRGSTSRRRSRLRRWPRRTASNAPRALAEPTGEGVAVDVRGGAAGDHQAVGLRRHGPGHIQAPEAEGLGRAPRILADVRAGDAERVGAGGHLGLKPALE